MRVARVFLVSLAFATTTAGYAAGLNAVEVGGAANSAGGEASVAVGGYNNLAYGNLSVVTGGYKNLAGQYATVSGGVENIADVSGSVGGGNYNNAGPSATVAGGVANYAAGTGSTISGGAYNQATGAYSAVLGGLENKAQGLLSTAIGGRRAIAKTAGSMVLADSQNADAQTTLPDQLLMRFRNGVVVNGTISPAVVPNVSVSWLSQSIILPPTSTVYKLYADSLAGVSYLYMQNPAGANQPLQVHPPGTIITLYNAGSATINFYDTAELNVNNASLASGSLIQFLCLGNDPNGPNYVQLSPVQANGWPVPQF